MTRRHHRRSIRWRPATAPVKAGGAAARAEEGGGRGAGAPWHAWNGPFHRKIAIGARPSLSPAAAPFASGRRPCRWGQVAFPPQHGEGGERRRWRKSEAAAFAVAESCTPAAGAWLLRGRLCCPPLPPTQHWRAAATVPAPSATRVKKRRMPRGVPCRRPCPPPRHWRAAAGDTGTVGQRCSRGGGWAGT